ncbi:Citrate lyase subunit beta [Weissella viridescens]|uniref:Citrate lyase subunit beta n=1 Tax=Weissella viridescens TaxID=1629 RepID=A0A380P248_WEIVI|nr:Citrate lyase subunit beta [Weissella viridescens]
MATEERLRRTMMFVPGNNPAMVKDAGIFGADSIMFDLEDAVSLPEKMPHAIWSMKPCKQLITGMLN